MFYFRTLKDLHKHVLRFAIYGRPKAFVNRDEISAYFESLNVQIDSVHKSFAVRIGFDGLSSGSLTSVFFRLRSILTWRTGKESTTRRSWMTKQLLLR